MMSFDHADETLNTAAHKRPGWCAWCGKSKPTIWKTTRAYTFGFHAKCRETYDQKAVRCGYPPKSRIIMAFLKHPFGPS